MNLGSFVVWLLIVGGIEEGDSSRWACIALPLRRLPRRQKEKMGWSGVRVTTSN